MRPLSRSENSAGVDGVGQIERSEMDMMRASLRDDLGGVGLTFRLS
jgi:hypothetical protein